MKALLKAQGLTSKQIAAALAGYEGFGVDKFLVNDLGVKAGMVAKGQYRAWVTNLDPWDWIELSKALKAIAKTL